MRRAGTIITTAALVAALSPVGARGVGGECDWPMYGHDAGHSFSQPVACSTITPLNVAGLRPKWFVHTDDSVTASPSVVDGVVYVGDWEGIFRAIDAADGDVLWTFQVDDPNSVGFGRIVSSAAVSMVAGTRVVAFGGGATLYLLGASDGVELARACTDPRTTGRCAGSTADIEIESSPVFVGVGGETRVLVGMDVHNSQDVGPAGVVSYRIVPGPGENWALEPLWKFDPETGLAYTTDASRAGDPDFVVTPDPITYGAGTGNGCGGVWSSPAVDTLAGLVFFGTSSCSVDGTTGWESMWAIELESGRRAWTFAPHTPAQRIYDDDFGSSAMLLPGGLVGEGSKDGWYYALSRTAGPVVDVGWRTHVAQAGHVSTDFAIGGIIGTPALGEVGGEPAIFITAAFATPLREPLDTGPDLDPALAEDPGRLFSLHAIAASDGRILWRSPLSRQSYGAPTYANGVVFVPSTFDLSVKAFAADLGGALLWQSLLIGAPSSAPAIVGDSIYLGSGTREQGLDFLAPFSGVWGFSLAP